MHGRVLVLLALVGESAAGKFGAQSHRRFVLLHGSGTSAGAFTASPTAIGGKSFLTGVPRRTDAGSAAPPNWMYAAVDSGSSDGSWFDDDTMKRAELSIAAVEEAIQDFGAVGVIGHEQGATVAALIAARSALGEGIPLKFAVICGAAMPTHEPYAELLHRMRDSGAALPGGTLHCIGGADASTEAASALELAACFAPSGTEILRHERGGAMPGESWWEETRGFPERVTGGRYWCTQHRGPWMYTARKASSGQPSS